MAAEAAIVAHGAEMALTSVVPLQPSLFSNNYAVWLTAGGRQANSVNALIWSAYAHMNLLFAGSVSVVAANPAAPETNVTTPPAPAAGAPAPAVVVQVPIPGGAYPANSVDLVITSAVFTQLTNNYQVALPILFELVAADQVSKLASRNVNGLLASYGYDATTLAMGDAIIPHLRYWSAKMPDVMQSATFKARIPNKLWLKYHTAAASSHELVGHFLSGTAGLMIPCANTTNLVNLAKAAPWDMQAQNNIPGRLVGLTSIYLRAVGMYPANKWYQGEKAELLLSPVERRYYESVFKKWMDLKTDSANINNAASLVALVGLVGAGANC